MRNRGGPQGPSLLNLYDGDATVNQIGTATLINAECLEAMRDIETGSVDMVLCDLPYGTTACKWDVVIPFEPLWAAYRRITKPNGAVVLLGVEPFSSFLRVSAADIYKYDWYWDKKHGANFAQANKRPLKTIECISVFYTAPPLYVPQKKTKS